MIENDISLRGSYLIYLVIGFVIPMHFLNFVP